ncbi:MAG: hypothetical protein R3A44_02815 [Caldilineaceae bacterium]
MNQRENLHFDIFGIVSTGTIWEFGKLSIQEQFFKTESYTLSQPEPVLGIWSIFLLSVNEIWLWHKPDGVRNKKRDKTDLRR